MCKTDYQVLRERYSPVQVPECPVCGDEMSMQRISSGTHIVYACTGEGDDGYFKTGRTFADEHYVKSRVTVVDVSDPDVLALLDELEAAKSKLNEQRENYEGVISDGSKRIESLEEIRSAAEKLVRCKGRYHSEQNYRALAALFGVTVPDLPPLEAEPASQTYKLAFLEWLSEQKEKIDVDCGCVSIETLMHWMKSAYEAGNSPVIPDSWISCSERMSPAGVAVLVCMDGIVQKNVYCWDGEAWNDWYKDYDEEPQDAFTHWMPLPEPPQEVSQ
ncbi:hypothetical protein M2356_004421 [Citrobacter farmeri]|nr:ead/Ea22-like family protein [Citrobacter farmeri]MCW2424706.1 hypothetical protein [Citrobacter farmeri]